MSEVTYLLMKLVMVMSNALIVIKILRVMGIWRMLGSWVTTTLLVAMIGGLRGAVYRCNMRNTFELPHCSPRSSVFPLLPRLWLLLICLRLLIGLANVTAAVWKGLSRISFTVNWQGW